MTISSIPLFLWIDLQTELILGAFTPYYCPPSENSCSGVSYYVSGDDFQFYLIIARVEIRVALFCGRNPVVLPKILSVFVLSGRYSNRCIFTMSLFGKTRDIVLH